MGSNPIPRTIIEDSIIIGSWFELVRVHTIYGFLQIELNLPDQKKGILMTIQRLRTFLETFQDKDGGFTSDDRIKATSEYLVAHKFCPQIRCGDTEKAKTFLKDCLSSYVPEAEKEFTLTKEILRISSGIPEDTTFLSEKFLDLSLSPVSVPVKSSLLLILFFQNVENRLMKDVLEEVVEYQKNLFKKVSFNNLYETAHNLMTFGWAQKTYNVEDIIRQSCGWLCKNVFSYDTCIDILAETVGVMALCRYEDKEITKKILSVVLESQNTDGGFPLFEDGKSEFHPSLLALWALAASSDQF